jgi:hypothetical protein
LDVPVQAGRRITEANPCGHTLREAMARPSGHKVGGPMLPRKASSEPMRKPYPKPTQVGEASSLRREVSLVKELGKLTP